jgi:glycogen debranching enzyme
MKVHMKITFKSDGKTESKELEEGMCSLLLSDGQGSHFSQGVFENTTFYHGLYCRYPGQDEWTMFKVIERIEIPDVKEIIKTEQSIEYITSTNRILCTLSNQTLHIKAEHEQTFRIILDPRKIYDFSTENREIALHQDHGITILYNKDNIKAHIDGATLVQENKEWFPREYAFDKKRSGNKEWFVYNGLDIKGNDISISQFIDTQPEHKTLKRKQPILKTDDITYSLAVTALEDLVVEEKGIYAGYYWFFQFWTRDEAIALGGLIKEKQEEVVKNVLLRHTSNVLEDGRLQNRFPHAELGSADGIGWVVKRLADAWGFFNEKEQHEILDKLEDACALLEEHHTVETFAVNKAKETWMDTEGSTDDVRAGARIEIQALRLHLYTFLAEKTGKKEYEEREQELKKNVRDHFFHGTILADGLLPDEREWIVDKTIRPNIFLAYYIYPELLEQEEWESVFDTALEHLWLEWGGLTTIEKGHKYFKDTYTGENDDSYHRGDSWFFVNNLAAIALHRCNAEKYEKYISKIGEASSFDLKWQGILGASSEVSSAKELRAEGTWQQAWSLGTLIELFHEHKN